MKQEGLIDCTVEALGLDVGTVNQKAIPAKAKLLVKDTGGDVVHGDFSYCKHDALSFWALKTMYCICC